jgi:hypothetical protein
MIIAALFMIFPNWKQPRCFSVGKCVKTMVHIHTSFSYFVIKNDLSSYEHTGHNAYCSVKKANILIPTI